MYSPQISESLIPVLYRLGRVRGIPMTRLVNGLLLKALVTETVPAEIQVMVDEVVGKRQVA